MLVASLLAVLALLSTYCVSTNVMLPMYIYPNPGENDWTGIISAVTEYPSLKFCLIVNPSSGPLNSKGDDYNAYTSAMEPLRQAAAINNNVIFLGYVRTQKTGRSMTEVQADIDAWTLFPELLPNGIFFDEVPSTAADSSYYQALVSYTKTKITNAYTVLNPGAPAASTYFSYADQVVIYEDSASASAHEGVNDVSSSKFSAILYSVGSDDYMESNTTQFKNDGYGSLYVTNSDSYTALGSDWPSFLKVLSGSQAGGL